MTFLFAVWAFADANTLWALKIRHLEQTATRGLFLPQRCKSPSGGDTSLPGWGVRLCLTGVHLHLMGVNLHLMGVHLHLTGVRLLLTEGCASQSGCIINFACGSWCRVYQDFSQRPSQAEKDSWRGSHSPSEGWGCSAPHSHLVLQVGQWGAGPSTPSSPGQALGATGLRTVAVLQ